MTTHDDEDIAQRLPTVSCMHDVIKLLRHKAGASMYWWQILACFICWNFEFKQTQCYVVTLSR